MTTPSQTPAPAPTVRIDRDRLWATLMELKEIGAYDDEATGLRGVRRLALTDADAEARRRCLQWMAQAGLEVRVLATYGPIPGDVIAVRRNLDPVRYELAKKAFEDASKDESARPLLRAVFGGEDLHDGIEPGHETLRLAYERGVASGLFD